MPYTTENRCEHIKSGGENCKSHKLKGSKFCNYHAQRLDNSRVRFKTKDAFATDNGLDHRVLKKIPRDRMNFYGQRLGPKLSALIQETVEAQNAHDISLEVATVKAISSQSVGIYDSIMELPDGAIPSQARQQLLHDAGQVVVTALEQSTRLVERSAKIFALTAEKIDPLAIDKVTKQICRFVYLCFENYSSEQPGYEEFDEAVRKIMIERIQMFDKMVSEELQLPSLSQLGTTITPDQQVVAMINSVPFTEE